MNFKSIKYSFLIMFLLASSAFATSVPQMYARQSLAALVAIDGAKLNDGDAAMVPDATGAFYPYRLNATSGAAVNSPTVLSPTLNAGTKRWILLTVYTEGGSGSVVAVTGTSPIVSSGGTSPAISIPAATNAIPGYATASQIAAIEANSAKTTNATHTGDVTGSGALTIAAKAITLAKMADISTATILGRNSAGTGIIEALTTTTVKNMLGIDASLFPVCLYGAIGSASDETSKIQNAIYAAEYAVSGGLYGATVDFGNATYRYSTLTINTANIRLQGKGKNSTVLKKIGTTGNGIVFLGDSNTSLTYGCSISGITLSQYDGTATSGSQLLVQNCGKFYMRDISVVPNYGWSPSKKAFNGISCVDVSVLVIESADTSDVVGDGLSITTCLDTFITNSINNVAGRYGSYFSTCSGIYAVNMSNWGNVVNAFRIDAVAAATPVSGGNNYHFYTHCIGDTSGSHNFWIANLNIGTFTACWAATQIASSAAGSGFAIIASSSVALNNCVAITNNTNGAYFYNSIATSISGGQYNDNGRWSASSPGNTRAGILADSSDYIINGPTCKNIAGSTQQYGIYLNPAYDNLTFVNTATYSNAIAGYYNPYTPSSTKIITQNR